MKKHLEMEHGEEEVPDEWKNVKKKLSPVLCNLCGKLLTNKYLLAKHMKKVHNPDVTNVDEFKCDVSFTFSPPPSLFSLSLSRFFSRFFSHFRNAVKYLKGKILF